MRLFGNSSGPHLAHFHATCEGDQAELRWEVRDADEVRWRVLRSEREFADSADGIVGSGQEIVMDGTDTSLSDRVVRVRPTTTPSSPKTSAVPGIAW